MKKLIILVLFFSQILMANNFEAQFDKQIEQYMISFNSLKEKIKDISITKSKDINNRINRIMQCKNQDVLKRYENYINQKIKLCNLISYISEHMIYKNFKYSLAAGILTGFISYFKNPEDMDFGIKLSLPVSMLLGLYIKSQIKTKIPYYTDDLVEKENIFKHEIMGQFVISVFATLTSNTLTNLALNW